MPTRDSRIHHRTCNLCEAMCGIRIEADGDRIVSIRGDKDDPFSRGYICPKAAGLQDLHEDPDRLHHPVRRTSSGFTRIGWDEAFDEVANRIQDTQDAHGRNAVALYLGNPNVHNHGSLLFGLPFAQALRTRSKYSATSVDQLPHHLASLLMFGHLLVLPVPDVDRTDFIVFLGSNPAASNGSMMTAAGIGKRLQAVRDRGGEVVLVDPRRTETAELASRHLFIRPGTDVFLLLAMLHTLFAEDRVALGRLSEFTDGLDVIRREVADFPPERAAAATGIDAASIRSLARDFAAAKSAVCHARMGASTQEFGAVTQWLTNVLNIVTGNLDRPGGAMFTTPAIDLVAITARAGQKGHFDKGRSRVRKLPEFNGEYPAVTMADEILTEGEGRVRAMITVAGNPVLSTPNGKKLEKAFEKLDFMASVDIYVNETTRHANIILPPTTALEHDHYDLALHVLAVRNTAKWSPALFAPADDARHDWQIFQELIARLGSRGPARRLAVRARRAALSQVTPERMLDVGLRLGPYGRSHKLTLKKLREAEHGVDLGPLVPRLPERLYTPGRRIPLAPEVFVADLARARGKLSTPDAENGFDLRLIGRRHLRSNNSWMHNSHRLVKGPDRCTLLIHPDDAARRGLASTGRARVSSRVGAIELGVEVSDEMMPGVVSIPHGFGHDRPGIQLSIASEHAGVSINDLTDDALVDELSGNAALSGVPVRVEAV